MPPAPVAVWDVSPRSLASWRHRSSLASNIPGYSRMTQARCSGPNGIALQFPANAVDENAAEKPINAKMILSVAITGLVSISASPMSILARGIKLPNIRNGMPGIKHESRNPSCKKVRPRSRSSEDRTQLAPTALGDGRYNVRTRRRPVYDFGMHFIIRGLGFWAPISPPVTCLILPFPQVPSSTKITDPGTIMPGMGSCLTIGSCFST
jgi:hypothetical protein